jgi:hypothetical protein
MGWWSTLVRNPCNARFKHGPQTRLRRWAGWPIGWALARPSGISPGGGRWIILDIWIPGSDLEPNGSLPERPVSDSFKECMLNRA